MNNLPLLLDAREAIDYYHQHPGMTDAEKAYVVAFLSGEGRSWLGNSINSLMS
ncbi:TPA: hypothetical protein ACF3JA_003511 [Escherichia coli]|uniref:hypothetical protein n=1 Tax=Enterobacter hormaechei TaxID=158836 RepID=UPI000AB1865A